MINVINRVRADELNVRFRVDIPTDSKVDEIGGKLDSNS